MQKRTSFLLSGLLLAGSLSTQAQHTQAINQHIQPEAAEMHIRFLASDELKGRDTGSDELAIAARYLAEHYRAWGAQPAPGMDSFLQPVPFEQVVPHKAGSLELAEQSFAYGSDFVARSGENLNWTEEEYVYLPYATPEEIGKAKLQGKWVITHTGSAPNTSPQAQFYGTFEKEKQLKEAGAKGLIEVYDDSQLAWQQILGFLGGGQLQLAAEKEAAKGNFVSLWLKPQNEDWWKQLEEKKKGRLSGSLSGKQSLRINSPNVLALIPGSDPKLKSEYVVLSAHYDHVGVGKAQEGDSIFNGARDNAVGTAALLMAAQYFTKNPPKRSILLASWTAEEKGLLGSKWFIEHSPIPLNQLVYNLNIDGAGYNDTSKVTVIGLERTTAEDQLMAAAQSQGLTAIQDPMPEQNLFYRSDNVHFARVGIPAPTFSMGLTAFDAEVGKYYHQAADEAESLDFHYVNKYIRAFTEAAERIANAPEAPFWQAGDKYEAAGKTLFKR